MLIMQKRAQDYKYGEYYEFNNHRKF
jgi:hypothetical protein